MSDFVNVTLLAILQGVAEFLPISSSGHLVIGQHLLNMNEPGMRLEIFLHVGTLASIFAFYRRPIAEIIAGLFSHESERRLAAWGYAAKIIVSALPAVVVYFALKKTIDDAFEHEMGRAFATADVVVARAGASTCFELALTGKPAFLIPMPTSMRNHQHYNAAAFAEKQAAAEGRQNELTPRTLANWLLHKAENRYSLAEMARKISALAVPDAAAKVADLVERVARRKARPAGAKEGDKEG